MDKAKAAGDLLQQEAAFVFEFFQAAEAEARGTERYLLVALGAIYSFLFAQGADIPPKFLAWAWYVPLALAFAAALRALGLVFRQRELLDNLKIVEGELDLPAESSSGEGSLGRIPGWARWAGANQKPVILATGVIFYLLLIVLTLIVAVRMT